MEAERHDGLYIVPCLNEELVIGETVRRLLDKSRCTIVVVDDGGTDETALRAQRAAEERGEPERLIILTRRGEESRQGKRAALHAAYPLVLEHVKHRGLAPESLIVAVMDADGSLSPDVIGSALALVSDPQVGGVQASWVSGTAAS